MIEKLFTDYSLFFALGVSAWVLPWKGVALWKAGQKKDLGWFIALLVLNTLAVLEILYIFGFSKRKSLKEKNRAIKEEK